MATATKKNATKYDPSPKSDIPTCPAFVTLALIANKWSVKILYTLIHADGKALRFGEIQKALGNITQRELTKHLREFEAAGLVTRVAFAQVPPRVEYTITDLGLSLRVPMDALSEWAEKNGALIAKNRENHCGD